MALLERDQFLLGFFSTNCSSGLCATTIPERWVNSCENNVKAAKLADEAGLDFMLPVARWVGFGGETNFHGNVLEAVTWRAGLLAIPKSIHILTTMHTGFHKPIVAAKQLATIDQISNSRIGLNIVAG
ncbi:hypothetical protein AC579_8817 [Pseudocercospora musae]|uniref:Luciferase-like domain-containing protein n=1 Tax=Pseudocercospora musae TaxID=113226 RepID=A0A139I565_9PEZI|nr:hypothetical protein AC579_8817 [Pseudocercospora musae]